MRWLLNWNPLVAINAPVVLDLRRTLGGARAECDDYHNARNLGRLVLLDGTAVLL